MIDKTNETQQMEEKVLNILGIITINARINQLVFENVTMGNLQPNSPVPIDAYLAILKMKNFNFPNNENFFNGGAIIKKNVIDKERQYFYKDFYYGNMNFIFSETPKRGKRNINELCENDDIYLENFNTKICNYIKNLYPLFEQIVEQKVEYDIYNLITDVTNSEQKELNKNISKLLVNIICLGKRRGSRVDSYMKKISKITPCLSKIIKLKKGHYYIENNDTDSIDFKLALLSTFNFMMIENFVFFNQKIQNWSAHQKIKKLT